MPFRTCWSLTHLVYNIIGFDLVKAWILKSDLSLLSSTKLLFNHRKIVKLVANDFWAFVQWKIVFRLLHWYFSPYIWWTTDPDLIICPELACIAILRQYAAILTLTVNNPSGAMLILVTFIIVISASKVKAGSLTWAFLCSVQIIEIIFLIKGTLWVHELPYLFPLVTL